MKQQVRIGDIAYFPEEHITALIIDIEKTECKKIYTVINAINNQNKLMPQFTCKSGGNICVANKEAKETYFKTLTNILKNE